MVPLLNTMLQWQRFMPCTKFKNALEHVFIVLEKGLLAKGHLFMGYSIKQPSCDNEIAR